MSNITNSTLSLLAGASLGAIATYFMDPELGDRRRQAVRTKGEHALSGTVNAVTSHLHDVSDQARDAVGSVSSKLSDYASKSYGQVSEQAGQIAGQIASRVNSVSSKAQDIHDEISDRANSAYEQGRRAVLKRAGVPESHPIETSAELALGVIGVAAISAGAMYYFDPGKGRARRAMTTDKFVSWARGNGRSIRRYGRHLGNQLKGVAHELKRNVPEEFQPTLDKANGIINKASNGLSAASS